MKRSTFPKVVAALFLLIGTSLFAQSESNLWTPISNQSIQGLEKQARKAMPLKYELFRLHTARLNSILSQAPSRKSNLQSNVIIELPTVGGVLQKFRVHEASVLDRELQNKYPSIQSYVAQGLDDPTAIARFSVSQIGVNIMISSVHYKTVYLEPITKDLENYLFYSRGDKAPNDESFECLVDDDGRTAVFPSSSGQLRNADDGKLRTFRLALACTGEYAQWHLNDQGVPSTATDAVKKAAVLAAMNVSMTRVNGVFERDLSLTMEIIGNNDEIIFLNSSSDPYTNNDGFAMLGQNQTEIDNTIGSANYDIGHVFSTGGGGVASLNSPCTGNKARGVTGLFSPKGDSFDIDYVAHEMGHQYGGNHTQNNNCQRSNRSVEPGSASTIMGYAGICAPNVQNNSDDYFNGINIAEMWINISAGASTCAAQSNTGNDAPVVDAGDNYVIPASTPFVLKGSATDPNSGDVLSYCWEQMDVQAATMPPQSTSTGGPAFRSLSPSSSGDRYMPALPTVLNGQTSSTWEVVPSVSRNMNFRLTVRDNVAGGASSGSDTMFVTVNGASGPFEVTSQNSAVTWETGSTQTVTWDVANTNVAPVDAANVDILLSLDGGSTFSEVVVTGIPNSGTADITVPNVSPSTQARIMVAGSGNIFYNVNSTNFIIEEGTFGIDDANFENFALWPNPSSGEFNLSFTPDTNDDVVVTLHDIRGRKVHQINYESGIVVNGRFEKTFNFSEMSSGMYLLTVTNGNKTVTKRILKR